MPPRRLLDGPWLEPAPTRPRSSAAGDSGRGDDRPLDPARGFAGNGDDEDELARLIDEVREARERLSRLIATIKSERRGWDEREQRWERWRSQLRNPPRKSSRRDVH
jgi:hypothetical protein